MPDSIERKRLKKKMLERWENEGGRVADDPVVANQSKRSSKRDDAAGRASVSTDSSKVDTVSSRKKRRPLTQK